MTHMEERKRIVGIRLLFTLIFASCAGAQISQLTSADRTAVPVPGSELPTQMLPSAQTGKHDFCKRIDKYDLSRIGNRCVGQGLNFYSKQAEHDLGIKLSNLAEQQLELIDDAAITEYVNRIEQRLLRNSDSRVPIAVKVIRDTDANAYSIPGGFVYITAGMILAAENEAELAAALAHETAHQAARHGTKFVTKQRIWKWSLLIGAGPAGYLLSRTALPLFLFHSERSSEYEADLLGFEYQYSSGYDPSEFVRLLKNLAGPDEEKESLWEQLTDSHPSTRTRIARAERSAALHFPSRAADIIDTSEFHEMKDRVALLMGIRGRQLGY